MDKESLEQVRNNLEERKKSIEDRLSQISHKIGDEKYAANYPDYGDDEESQVTELEDYGGNISLEKNLAKELKETKKSLKRLDEGTYGICIKCGKEIEPERVKAYPAAAICVNCEKNR
jgi:DnaK suppressor protein